MKPVITIEYCPKCGWMLRAAYFAQELLTTFADDVHGVLMCPSEVNGIFKFGLMNPRYSTANEWEGFPRPKS